MLTLVLTRHGLTDRSTPEQHLGQRIDVSINDAGRRQAEALARRLAPVTFDRVFTSPLFRARETASLLVRNVAIEADPRLREMDYGAWEGRTYEQIAESDGDVPAPLGGGARHARVPRRRVRQRRRRRASGRSCGDLLDEHRSWHAKASFRAATSGWGSATPRVERPILAVAHSTTNRILICVALAIEVREFRRRLDAGPGQPDRAPVGPRGGAGRGADARPQRHRAPARAPTRRPGPEVRPRAAGAMPRVRGCGRGRFDRLGHLALRAPPACRAATTAARRTARRRRPGSRCRTAGGCAGSRASCAPSCTPAHTSSDRPGHRAEGRVQDELADRHASHARRERDERPDDRQEPAEEHGRRAVLLEERVGDLDLVRADEQVPAVALEERPAAPGADGVARSASRSCSRASPR